MKILIIGGTKFLGRHLTVAALASCHEVTLFNRGKHSSTGMPEVEQIHGDRNTDLNKLKNRNWDAVIDTCGYLPQTVKASVEALKDAVENYVFVSSISAYADFSQPDYDESAPLARLTEEQRKRVSEIDPKDELNGRVLGAEYGALKVLCEQEAEKAMPGRVLIVRPGVIVGSFDPTDRFTYWVMRVAQGGEILAPSNAAHAVQFIDVRDLSEWMLRMIERKETGVFNANSKPGELKFGAMLEEIKNVSGSDAEFTWVSENFLLAEKVQPWGEMPLWLPEQNAPEIRWHAFANVDKALAAGLEFRPLNDTIQDVLSWRKENLGTDEMKAGISRERERELLEKWHETESAKIS
ncbi:MAG: NAD-dependent epimerase/dehydratase family protein [Acidobacteriota bacterium]|nr:NAD-dependent epimerase/dehydratase family protein [Acidobacteriota bacterium]